MINCCDFYEKGAGYEFSVCDGIGATIRTELIGGAQDMAYAKMAEDTYDLAPAWNELTTLVDNYCEQKSAYMSQISGNSTNATATIQPASYIIPQLNLPLSAWKQDALTSIGGLGVWLSRYQQYVQQAE